MKVNQSQQRDCRSWSEGRSVTRPVLPGVMRLRLLVATMFGGIFLAMVLYLNGCTGAPVAGRGTSDETVGRHIAGRITKPDSIAVGGLPVTLLAYAEETQAFVDTMTTTTDPKGNFSFEELDAGIYLLKAMGAGGLSVMEEVIVDEGQDMSLGTLVADTMGSLLIRKTTDTTVSSDTYVRLYKGKIIIATHPVSNTYSKDSLPPGEFKVRMFVKIIPHDAYFLPKQNSTRFDKVITIRPRTMSVDTFDINEEFIRTAYSVAGVEIRALKDFLVKAGCDPFISAGWFDPDTGRIRIIEATTTNGMSLDSAAHALAAFPGIEKIRLSGFKGTVIPDTLFTFSGLTELSLTDGEISGVSERIAGLGHLRILRLTRNAITQLPGTVLDRSSPLQSADFSGNPLQRIEWEQQDAINSLLAVGIKIILAGKPYAINERDYRALLSFFNLNGLDDRIVHTYITTGTGINEPDVVTGLNMNDVTIKGFPGDFGNLAGLRDLYIARNTIDTLPQVLDELTMVQTLHITNGTIGGLPLQLGRCTRLRTIDFSNNRITRLPKWLSILDSLKYADFSTNCIDTSNTIVPAFCVIGQQYSDSTVPAPDSLFVGDTATVSTIVNYGHAADLLPLMNYIQCRNNRVVLLRLVIDNDVRMAAFDTLCAMAASLDSLQTLHVVMRNGAEAVPALSTTFPRLEEFIATGGALRSLPVSFAASFPVLKRIALPGNRFEEVPPMLRSLITLVAVDLYYNRLINLTQDDSSWLDGVSAADHRVLWDTGFGFSYVQGKTWQKSQLERDSSGTDP